MASRKEEKENLRRQREEAERSEQAAARRQKLFAGIGIAVLAAVAVVVGLVIASQSGDDDGGGNGAAGADAVQSELAGVPQKGTVLGKAGTDVRIVEFGDLQCPACAQFSESVIPDLIDGPVKSGDAQLEFQHFVIIGPDSDIAARAALAASEQDRYWEFIELFYRNQGVENGGYVTEEFLTDIATGAGVEDLDAWNASREDPKWERAIADTQSEAATLGLSGTPSIVVEGPGGTEVLGTPGSAGEIEAAIDSVR
jgi:protein-disulfide isomerase